VSMGLEGLPFSDISLQGTEKENAIEKEQRA
jgi:hypothetical protein